MFIKTIRLKNFRNYESLDLDFSKNINVLYGENAQGKTNILESIFLCASGRSHRTSKDAEMVMVGKNGYVVELIVRRKDRDVKIEICYDLNERKKIRINEIPEKKIGSLIGNLNAVIFSPEDLDIIKDGPSARRRFLDITISQISPGYFYDLQQYGKILANRNYLLREIPKNSKLIDTLDIWSRNLADVGSRIIIARQKFIRNINLKLRKNHSKLTAGKESLELVYRPSVNICELEYEKEIAEIFFKTLQKERQKEILKATTLYGPQRDDFDLMLNKMDVKLYGSQGQQRTCVLSVKLSEVDIMQEETGELPVLLLDDVMSELDNNRQEFLLNSIKDIQVFVTCTNKNIFLHDNIHGIRFFKVEKGEVVRQ
ncbi:MAG TPA: DNA replication/repair protein RecF [Clostridiaceae bacterium]|nr:DNA replication/repair protein RecF [Clostridiaceae bacterium]